VFDCSGAAPVRAHHIGGGTSAACAKESPNRFIKLPLSCAFNCHQRIAPEHTALKTVNGNGGRGPIRQRRIAYIHRYCIAC
jgi:hypothetical protein